MLQFGRGKIGTRVSESWRDWSIGREVDAIPARGRCAGTRQAPDEGETSSLKSLKMVQFVPTED